MYLSLCVCTLCLRWFAWIIQWILLKVSENNNWFDKLIIVTFEVNLIQDCCHSKTVLNIAMFSCCGGSVWVKKQTKNIENPPIKGCLKHSICVLGFLWMSCIQPFYPTNYTCENWPTFQRTNDNIEAVSANILLFFLGNCFQQVLQLLKHYYWIPIISDCMCLRNTTQSLLNRQFSVFFSWENVERRTQWRLKKILQWNHNNTSLSPSLSCGSWVELISHNISKQSLLAWLTYTTAPNWLPGVLRL